MSTENMVPILGDNSEHVAHAWRKIGICGEKKSDIDCIDLF